MEKYIQDIICKHLKISKLILIENLDVISADFFSLSFICDQDDKLNLSSSSFSLFFRNMNANCSIIKKEKTDKDLSKIRYIKEVESKKNKNNSKFLNELLSNIAVFSNNSCNIRINKNEKDNPFHFYNIHHSKIYSFKLNLHANSLLKEINDEIIEIAIKDYILEQSGIHFDGDVRPFINMFYKSNSKAPFVFSHSSQEAIFSEEFKSMMSFKTEDEFENVIELFKINYGF